MFSLLKRKNPYEQNARNVYGQVLAYIRHPFFYKECGVPDSFDGRFDLLLLHLFMIVHTVLQGAPEEQAERFNQALFDATFADMDQTLREMGIGDMGLPKHMRRMMKAFNGRMHSYEQAIETGIWDEPLRNNLYGTLEDIPPELLEAMTAHIQKTLEGLQAGQSGGAVPIIENGIVHFEGGKAS